METPNGRTSRNAPPSSKSRSRPLPNFKSWFTRSNSKNACGKETTRPRYPLRKGHWPDLRSPSSRGIAHSGITSPEAPLARKPAGRLFALRKSEGSFRRCQESSPRHSLARRAFPILPGNGGGSGGQIRVFGQLERLEPCLRNSASSTTEILTIGRRGILEGLASVQGSFWGGSTFFGRNARLLSRQKEVDASPDPWWIAGKICFVFEDHAGGVVVHTRCYEGAASLHPSQLDWGERPVERGHWDFPVLISPVTRAEAGAVPILARSFSGL